jgi:protein TonB
MFIPSPPVDVEGRGGTQFGADRSEVPIVRVEPQYPTRAASKQIEGWVRLQFTITENGTVRDAVVVDAEPHGYFEETSLQALARWKYQPKVFEGRAVERRGVQVLLRFDLEEN